MIAVSSIPLYSSALLALRRFVRGTLRQLGIGVLSLVVILSMSPHAATGPEFNSNDLKADSHSLSKPVFALEPLRWQPSQPLLQADVLMTETDTATSEQFPGLQPRMTQHRLTSARLSVPVFKEGIVRLTEAN